MLRKNESFIANVIGAMPSFAVSLRSQQRSCALAFADALEKENPNFDRFRFMLVAASPIDEPRARSLK